MASDSETAAGPQTEIVAKTQFDLWKMRPVIMPIAFAIVVLFLIWGIRDALYLLLIVLASVSLTRFTVRYWELHRALLDREGMTLLPRGIGRLSARPVHFRWDEVVEVRRAPFWSCWTIRLRLNRPRKFWTFRPRQPNSILVPKGIFAAPHFAEALRAYLPAERIHADLALGERPSLSARYWWVLVLVILLCAAVAAGCSFAIISGESFAGAVLTAILALVIGALAMVLCAQRAPATFGLVAGLVNTFLFLSGTSLVVAFFIPGGLALIAGCLGAAAGALVGAALMVINDRKSGRWPYVGATFLLAAAGFWCGWAGFRQVAGIRVDVGSLDYRSPWTPKGDAFLMTDGILDKPTTVSWYSSDLKLERRVVLPASAHRLALGQEAALFRVNGEPDAQLWFVPRGAEPRQIDQAPSFGYGIMSPDSRHALIPIWGAQRERLGWKICDLATGKLEPVNLPVPLKEVSVIALRDDLTVLWLSGSRPLDKGNNKMNRHSAPPENGEFPYPGKPYVVWSWKTNSAESPARLYAARTQWLDWSRADKPERLHVCRVAEKPPVRFEYVALDFTQSPPAETTISEQEYDTHWTPQTRSFDGRFAVAAGKSDSFAPGFIVDTKTGRKFRMDLWSSFLGGFPLYWSPSANKFLMEIPGMKLAGGLWCWHREFEKNIEGTMVVCLVDMDRQ